MSHRGISIEKPTAMANCRRSNPRHHTPDVIEKSKNGTDAKVYEGFQSSLGSKPRAKETETPLYENMISRGRQVGERVRGVESS
jgi:hypothetical protein